MKGLKTKLKRTSIFSKENKLMLNRLLVLLFQCIVCGGIFYLLLLAPDTCHASVESSLDNIKSKLTGVILPTLAVVGIGIAAGSFFIGHENAKRHAIYAFIGCALTFGIQALLEFMQRVVN